MSKVGLKQVARAAGVSVATVSYVMSGRGRVGEETKKRVLEVARELGFVRNDSAARLKTEQSRSIGVILNNIVNPFFSELVAGIEAAAYGRRYLTLISTAQNDLVRQKKPFSSMMSQRVAGIILSPVHETEEADLNLAHSKDIPVVSCVRDVPNSVASFVGVAEKRSGYLAATALMDAGHRAITFVGGYEDTTTWNGRRDGIVQALSEKGLSASACLLVPGALNAETTERAISDLYSSGRLGTALLLFNDDIATFAYRTLRDCGVQIGADIAVASFDNVSIASSLYPPLTSVDIFPADIGRVSAETVIDQIERGVAKRSEHVLKPRLKQRQSIRP